MPSDSDGHPWKKLVRVTPKPLSRLNGLSQTTKTFGYAVVFNIKFNLILFFWISSLSAKLAQQLGSNFYNLSSLEVISWQEMLHLSALNCDPICGGDFL